MKKLTILILAICTLGAGYAGFVNSSTENYFGVHRSFSNGEILKYRVHFGLINAAEATMVIDDRVQRMNGKPCYKIDIYGETNGFFDVFMKVRDNWGSYVDTTTLVSHKFYRYIEEGKYRKYEEVYFDHKKDQATVHHFDRNTRKLKNVYEFDIPKSIQDIVSGAYLMRTIDFSKMKKGETFKMSGFFDNEVHSVDVRYMGIESLKTKLGEYSTIVLSPIVPENKFFKGDTPIKLWISNDYNKVPLKIQADLVVGSIDADIKEVKNLKYPIGRVRN
jgi:hypothetical protein